MNTRDLDYNNPDNFIQGIILVHPLQPNSILNFLFDSGKEHLAAYDELSNSLDSAASSVNAIVKDNAMLSDDAIIGSHLNFEMELFSNSLIDRPQIHWWWNGLFHANSGGDWEQSLIAYIEPLTQFKHVLGCAYYDTMTVGPHKLSDQSCILLPQEHVNELQSRLKNYSGKIIGYDSKTTSIREAINLTVAQHYPNSFQLLNYNHIDINSLVLSLGDSIFFDNVCNEHSYNKQSGFFSEISISTPNKSIFPLIMGEKTILHDGYKQFAKGRHIGLHRDSPTDNESNPLLKILMAICKQPGQMSNPTIQQHFIGHSGSRNPNQLCILKVYEIYKNLSHLSIETGIQSYATYLIKKAIIADIRSIHFDITGKPSLSIQLIDKMINLSFDHLLMNIDELYNKKTPQSITNYRTIVIDVYNSNLTLNHTNNTDAQNDHRTSASPNPAAQANPQADKQTPLVNNSFWSRNKNTIMLVGTTALIGAGVVASVFYYSRSGKNSS